jgi:hypothetical protein
MFADEMKRKRKKRRKMSKWTLIPLLIVAVVMAVIVAATLLLDQPKYTAEEYFEISTLSSGSFKFLEEGNAIQLHELTFNFTAVGGDAHEVICNNRGLARSEPVFIGEMGKGESGWITLTFGIPLYLPLKEEGWGPIRISVISLEASGTITVYLPGPSL